MVTFNNAGRFGNWFFECCTALAYSLRHGVEFHAPNGENTHPHFSPTYCHHLCNPNWNPRLEPVRLWENGHQYRPLPFEEHYRNKNVIIEGYRQSEKYFKDYRNEILGLLNFHYEKKEGIVSVHVRRGDYVHLRSKHPEVTKEWYESVMSLFPDKKFKFFSDDIKWCKDNFGSRDDCEFSDNNGDVILDITEMSCCEHNICSPSTFAWAAMWLNRNEKKTVIFPNFWFTEGWDNLDTSDIVPEWCIKI